MSEAALAWLAVLSAALLIVERGVRLVLGKRKEKQQIDEALEKQPLIKEQLEVGNIRGAVEILNQVITTQASALDRNEQEIGRLRDRETALEAESDGWQTRYQELFDKYMTQARMIQSLQDKVARLEAGAAPPPPHRSL